MWQAFLAQYVKVPAKNLWAVDERRLRPEIAAIYDPFGNAVHATTKVDLRGQRVAIFGCGPVGLFSILLARTFGAAKIIAVDINPKNLAMAKELDAHETILIPPMKKTHDWEHDPEVVSEIMNLTYGKGVDVSMEMAGPACSLNSKTLWTIWSFWPCLRQWAVDRSPFALRARRRIDSIGV